MSCINHLFPSSFPQLVPQVGSPRSLAFSPGLGHLLGTAHAALPHRGTGAVARLGHRTEPRVPREDAPGDVQRMDGEMMVFRWLKHGESMEMDIEVDIDIEIKKLYMYIYKWGWYGFKHGERGWGLAGSISLLYVGHVFFLMRGVWIQCTLYLTEKPSGMHGGLMQWVWKREGWNASHRPHVIPEFHVCAHASTTLKPN